MDQHALWTIEDILQTLVIGGIVLTPMFAISIRFALKPLLETYLRARQLPDAETVAQQVRVLEAEVEGLQRTLQAVLDTEDFRRRLTTPELKPEDPHVHA